MRDTGRKVRFLSIDLNNFKNVRNGKVSFPKAIDDKKPGYNIIGVYGQNGSGKTALVQAFETIQRLLKDEKIEERLVSYGENSAQILLEFELEDEIPYHVTYEIVLSLSN